MTVNKEDYIKAIYGILEDGGAVNNKAVAERLDISAASVSEMLKKLLDEGLVTADEHKGIVFTAQGLLKAKTLVKKHRLWEVFLVKHLNFSWGEVHEQAELLEHMTTDAVYERLDEYLGHPTFCPHGGIIEQSGTQERPALINLRDLAAGQKAVIMRVSNQDKQFLDYLTESGLRLLETVTVTLLSVAPYEGPLTLEAGGKTAQISFKAARYIYLKPLN